MVKIESVKAEKISSDLYVSDRSYRFGGDWPGEMDAVVRALSSVQG